MTQTFLNRGSRRSPEQEPSGFDLAASYLPVVVQWIFILGFGGLAAYATYDGLYQLIAANAPDGKIDRATDLPIKIFASLMIMMVVYVLYKLRTAQKSLAKLGFAIAYIVITLISTGLGFGFYWKWINSTIVQGNAERDAIANIEGGFETGAQQIRILKEKSKALAEHSKTMEDEEKKNGFTCDKVGKGDGPRQRLRADDALMAGGFEEFVKSNTLFVDPALESLKAKFSSVGHARDPDAQQKEIVDLNKEIKSMADRFNGFRTSKTLATYQQKAQARLDKKLFEDTPPRPSFFRCPDSVLEIWLSSVLGAIQDLPTLNPASIKTVVGSRATLEAFSRLGNFLLDLTPPVSSILFRWGFTAPWLTKIRAPSADTLTASASPSVLESKGLQRDDLLPLGVAILVDFCLFIATRTQHRIVVKGHPGAQNLAYELRKLSSALDAESLFNDYVFTRTFGHYIFVPVGVGLGINSDPDRGQRRLDRVMALAFAALDGPSVGLFKRMRFPGRFRPRRALLERGREYLGSHREYAVYRFYSNALQEILGALMRHPDTGNIDIGPGPRSPPKPADRTRTRPQTPDSAPFGSRVPPSPAPEQGGSRPGATPPPRGKPAGL
jgi:hypothetical protein